jgi:hypothetical protein
MAVGRETNHYRTALFHILAKLRHDPDSPTLLKAKRDTVAKLEELGDDAKDIEERFTKALSGEGGKSAARRGRRKK